MSEAVARTTSDPSAALRRAVAGWGAERDAVSPGRATGADLWPLPGGEIPEVTAGQVRRIVTGLINQGKPTSAGGYHQLDQFGCTGTQSELWKITAPP